MRKKKIIKHGLLVSLCFFVYAVFFQSMYCWIRYGTPLGGYGLKSFIYSLPFNYFPMVAIGSVFLVTSLFTNRISVLWKKVAVDSVLMSSTIVCVNLLFSWITGLSVSWGGSVFNGILIWTIIELYTVSIQKREAIRHQSLMEKEIIAGKFEIVKAYVNPHFLYNTLDMLCSIIELDNKNDALDFSLSLSYYYRRITSLMNLQKTSLEDELKLVENYISIVGRHYGDKLTFSVYGNPKESFSIIPFTIQLLVENALKHNIINEQNPMEIWLEIEKDGLTVTNTNNSNHNEGEILKKGLGLTYLNKMYQNLGKSLKIIEMPNQFSVTIPKVS